MRDRTRADQEATVDELARDAFRNHVLEPAMSYERCGVRNDSMYAFCVYIAPYFVAVWGDLGEFCIRHSDADSLKWILSATSRDYVLGKVVASRGARREFMLGDALRELDLRENELREEMEHELAADGPSDPGYDRVPVNLNDLSDAAFNDARAVKLRKVRQRFRERLDDLEPEAHAWAGAWYDIGESDPPACESWSSDLLWLWKAIETYRRLKAAQ